ncbi:exonuclease domain-containing protein [Flavihumibacter cheonanensis]|uniref:exonuclease domain-containing protein n=1 Tax=Flavihumibacter cheonanensis TaxID=1442385 RepID=UPI001EF96ED5|nr:exonuclease domain-containing protein [Flavihumibacter cheonanensis]MCG7751648.1 GIY-YIG nuclease family protein [Flavihumibacter cheonanensis]
MFAIVDIETTGGFASSNAITEIAIILHNGREEEGRYSTLINPGRPIPRAITALTGISDEMVINAPSFDSIAPHIHNLLQNRIFVAHHVNFDYSFVQSHLAEAGFPLRSKKLCTVRLARQVFPGLASYSLGNLCRSLSIPIENRHRAEGDAAATSILFARMVEADEGKILTAMTKGKNAEQFLPPNLPVEELDQLPQGPGVYYFESAKKQVLYVGKAVNLNKRVRTHFSNNDKGKRKQDMMRQVHHIRFTTCASELMALILESQEIRQLWPPFNRSQKKYHHRYGLYCYENRHGLMQLVIEKKRTNLPALHTFNWLQEGHQFIRRVKEKVEQEGNLELQEPVLYNQYLTRAIEEYQQQFPTVALVEKDHYFTKRYAVYLLEKGKFWGMGYLEDPYALGNRLDSFKEKISPSPDNDFIRGLLYQSLSSGSRISIPLEE